MSTFARSVALVGGAALIAGGGLALAESSAVAAGPTNHTPSCTGRQLAVGHGQSQGGVGHIGFPITFRNTSDRTCTIHGYPGLAALTKHGHVIANAKRTETGYLAGAPKGATVTLQPGSYASSFVEWVDMTSGGKACRTSHSIEITPADTTRTVHRKLSVGVCDLQVHPTTYGRTGTHQIRSRYGAARQAWIHAAKASSADQGKYFHRAARDLDAAKRDYSTQARQLRELAAIPETNVSKKQQRKAHHLVKELDAFFHTPKLFR